MIDIISIKIKFMFVKEPILVKMFLLDFVGGIEHKGSKAYVS